MKKHPWPAEPAKISHNPFGALKDRLGDLPAGPVAPQPKPVSEPPAGPQRAVVRIERKGRGGKEVTLIEKLDLPAKQLEKWLSELKKALGCGGVMEGDSLALQGDLRERVKSLLLARGVRKVTIG